jgi:predicted CopG family antitoxin
MNKVKINITIDEEIYSWLNSQRDMVPLSTYINYLLRERKEAADLIANYRKDSGIWKDYVTRVLAKIKGGDRFLEILSREYLQES